MRQQPVADGEGVARHAPPGAVGRGQGDRLDAVLAVGGHDRVPPPRPDPVAREPGGVGGALHGLAERYGAGVPEQLAGVGGVGERRDVRPGRRQARRDRQEQGPRSGDDDRTAGEHQAALEHGLRTARRDDPGQRPAGERQHLLVGPGREDDPVRPDRARLQRVEDEARFHTPDLTARQVRDPPGGDVRVQAPAQSPPGTPRVVQRPRPARPQPRRGLPVELPARLRRGVDQGDPHAPVAGRQRRRDPGGPRPDHRQVVPVPGHARLPGPRLPHGPDAERPLRTAPVRADEAHSCPGRPASTAAMPSAGSGSRPGTPRRSPAGPMDGVRNECRAGRSTAGPAVPSRGFRSPRPFAEAHRRPGPPYHTGPRPAAAPTRALTAVHRSRPAG